jgi:predicted nuclease of predicted toxin-antitoxin system
MRFLIDANLPIAVKTVLFAHGHESADVRDIGLRSATDEAIAQYARENHFTIVTRDRGFGNALRYPPSEHFGIVVLRLALEATASEVLALLQKFMEHTEVLEQLPGKTAIVTVDNIQLRSR